VTSPPLSSYTPEFPSDVRLSTGVLYIGDDVFGGTLGGISFNPNKEVVNLDFDGKRAPIAGIDRTARRRGVLSGTAQTLGVSDLEKFEPGGSSDSGWSGGAAYIPPQAGPLYESGMYLTNVRAVWQRGNGQLFQVRMPKALITTWQSADNGDQAAGIQFEIEARVDMSVEGASPSDAGYVYEYLDS
jgi:hypothetical protein